MGTVDMIETDVLIVGAGGCGLALSVLLTDQGVDHVQIERHPSTAIQPKASYLNQRTMEIFRQHGVEQSVLALGCPRQNMEQVRWVTTLGGDDPTDARTLATMSIFGAREMNEAWTAASPSAPTNLPQIRLEPLLEEHAAARAGRPVLCHHELLDWTDGADAITARVQDRDSGEVKTFRARYLIAADGGRTIGPRLGIRMVGPTRLKDFVSVYFTADLSKYADESSLITFLLNPEGSGMRNSGGLMQLGPTWGSRSEEWVLHFGQEVDDAGTLNQSTVVPHIRKLLKIGDVDIDVHKISHWILDRIVAERYRQGRIILAGDAAHRQPPMSGLGLNSGIHDSHNLAWKLAAVVRGHASDALLDTYQVERQPVGVRNADWALMASTAQALIDANLGLQPGMPVAAAKKVLARVFADTPTGAAMRWRVAQVIDTLKLEFQCHDMELGFYYDDGALVGDGTAAPKVDPAHSHYIPTTRPGHRLPHAWINGPAGTVSTHDLVGNAGTFLLITADAGAKWIAAAEQVAGELGVPIDVADIGSDGSYRDESGTWERLRGIRSDGAILVRPDNHIAWRSTTASADPRAVLLGVFKAVLSVSRPS